MSGHNVDRLPLCDVHTGVGVVDGLHPVVSPLPEQTTLMSQSYCEILFLFVGQLILCEAQSTNLRSQQNIYSLK